MMMATRRTHPVQRRVLVDEAFLREWITWGFKELTTYLEKQAAFAAYITTREGGADAPASRPPTD